MLINCEFKNPIYFKPDDPEKGFVFSEMDCADLYGENPAPPLGLSAGDVVISVLLFWLFLFLIFKFLIKDFE